MPPSGNKKNINLALNLSLVAVGMLALAFASVPLYRLFCEITGYGGTPRQGQATASSSTILNRNITVTFNADIDPHLPWGFKPSASQLTTKIGQQTVTHYVAHNNSTEPVTGRATYNVIPFSAGPYFVKIDCFASPSKPFNRGRVLTCRFYSISTPPLWMTRKCGTSKQLRCHIRFFL